MSNLNKPTADQAREAYKKLRLSSPRLAPAKPIFHSDNPLLPDTPDDETDQLPLALHGRPLKIEIGPFDTDQTPARGYVQLLWNNTPTGARHLFDAPINPDLFPFELELPGNLTVNPGRSNLAYVVNISGNTENSDSQSVNIDTMPPNGGARGSIVTVPAEVDRDGITREYLDANGGVVQVTIPEYGDAKIGDVISAYYGETIPTAVLFATEVRADTINAITVDLTEAHIGSAEGTKSIFYTLADRVGNIGPHSEFKVLEVTLTPAPTNLVPPKVPQAADLAGIDYKDALEGVGVQIDTYGNYVAGSDKVIVVWDGVAQNPVDIAGFPTFVTVPFRDVKGADEGPKNIRVSYSIVRGNRRYPEPTGENVDVDIRKPGPDNPDDPPGPVNPALDLVIVSGAVTTTPNMLLPEDKDQDATATVVIYENYKAGDVMQLYWKGVAVPAPGGVYEVVGTEQSDFPVPFTIPWASIDAGGNDSALPVHYTIKNPAINDNEDTSRPQSVSVSVNPLTVPDPEFQNLDPDFDVLNCNSLVNDPVAGWSVVVKVPGGEPRLAGQELTFTYQGWTDSAGSIEKSDTFYEVKFTPTTEQASNGFIIQVPYDPPILTTLTDWGSIEYTAVLDGFPATSQRHLVDVYMALTGGGTCQLNP